MTMLRISQLSRQAGVPASTLRYYEDVGLLPAKRSPGGYRLFDERAQQRLMFIQAAKRMRLSLTAIADLLKIWESSACRFVKQQLRPALDAQIGRADAAIAELQHLRQHLCETRVRLDTLPDRDQLCDPHCTFLLDHAAAPRPTPPVVVANTTYACSLDDNGYRQRAEQWHTLLRAAQRRPTHDGMHITLGLDRVGALTALITAEQTCCSFLGFTLRFTSNTVEMTVTGPPEVHPLITDLTSTATLEPRP